MTDMVNSPVHYATGDIECIDAMEAMTKTMNGAIAPHAANVLKYMWRCERKNGLEDIDKAIWYLNRMKETMERDAPMSNVFKDIDVFQSACDQTPSPANYDMYLGLIDEEYGELVEAVIAKDPIEQLDALVDILVVTIGAIRAGNMDGEGAWKEVMDTNFAKIDPDTGKVRKREDGKVLKPDGWRPPDLKAFIDLRL